MRYKSALNSVETDLIPWLITFVITITLGLEVGMLVGVLLSSSFLLYYAARPRVKILKGEVSIALRTLQFVLVLVELHCEHRHRRVRRNS